MTTTITSACLKGGSGKSTVAKTIATTLHARGHRTLVVDTDPQRTLLRWSARGADLGVDGPLVLAIEGDALRRDLPKASRGYDVVVIDCPPRHSRETRAAILLSDLVLVPISPGPGDLWALEETAALVDELRGGARLELVARAVLNRADDRTALTRDMRAAVTRHIPLLGVSLANRVAYPEAMASGEGVTTYDRRGRAAREAEALTDAALAAVEVAA